jgi:hypothetical protein
MKDRGLDNIDVLIYSLVCEDIKRNRTRDKLSLSRGLKILHRVLGLNR